MPVMSKENMEAENKEAVNMIQIERNEKRDEKKFDENKQLDKQEKSGQELEKQNKTVERQETEKLKNNHMYLEIDSCSENESFARVAVAAFCTRLDPILEEIEDIKTAVSEAVTNAVIHGYEEGEGTIIIETTIIGNEIEIRIQDMGCGIDDIEKAKEPLFTTRPEEERSGMGFSFMEIFMDGLEVISEKNKGTTVIMKKTIDNLNS